jgi:hypothetical protein
MIYATHDQQREDCMMGDLTMNRDDEQRIVMIVLRVAGILTVLIGLILTTQTIIELIMVHSAASDLPRGMNVNLKGPVGKMGAWAIIGRLFICAWGAVLYALARVLADGATGDAEHQITPTISNP